MEFPTALVLNAIIAGLLLGGFYAAVSVGISISFGMLDVVNIAHPGFIILGSYIAYIVSDRLGLDPILVAVAVSPLFFLLGMALYRVYYLCFERHGERVEAVAAVDDVGDIGAEDDEARVGDVHHVEHPERDGDAHAHRRVEAAQQQPGDDGVQQQRR